MPAITSKVLKVLLLFSPDTPMWTAEDVASALTVSISSAYRYLQELCAAGLLEPTHGQGYTLGPAIVQLDLLVRRHDVLISAASPVMRWLLENTTQSATAILCRRYRERVICIHQEDGSLPHPRAAYERGVAMPLFMGATSKVILAHEPLRMQRRTYLENEAAIRARAGAVDWQSFKAMTNVIRQRGYDETESEVTPGIHGIAAPVFNQGRVVAAISLIFAGQNVDSKLLAGFSAQTIQAGLIVSEMLETRHSEEPKTSP